MHVQCTCLRCGTAFTVPASALQRNRGRYCSKACSGRAPKNRPAKPTADLFWARVDQAETCWIARGKPQPFGYKRLSVPTPDGRWRNVGMHRVAWFVATGHWPTTDEYVCHDCPGGDNPSCVRNDEIGVYTLRGVEYPRRGHLWLGDSEANRLDMVMKGRQVRGHRQGHAKLTENDILDIRRLHASGEQTIATLASTYHVSISAISRAVRQETWTHV